MENLTVIELLEQTRLLRDRLKDNLVALQQGLNEANASHVDDDDPRHAKDEVRGVLRGVESLLAEADNDLVMSDDTRLDDDLSWLQPLLRFDAAGLSTKLDGKFYGAVFRHKDDTLVDPQDYVIFLARDIAFRPVLEYYLRECEQRGCAQPQLDAIKELISRLVARQVVLTANNQMKLSDVDKGELAWTTPPPPPPSSSSWSPSSKP